MYTVNNNFLYVRNSNITCLKFVEGDSYTTTLDTNKRTITITFQPNGKFQDLASFPGFTIRRPGVDLIEEEIRLRSDDIVINGIRYYFYNDVMYFSQFLVRGRSTIFSADPVMPRYIIGSDDLDWDVEDYVDSLNSSFVNVYVSVEDEDEFKIININNIDTTRTMDVVLDNDEIIKIEAMSISGVDLAASFIEYFEEEFPDISIIPQVDEKPKLQKSATIMYDSKLPMVKSDQSSPLHYNSERGRLALTTTNVLFEFLSDDIKRYLTFRESCLLMTGPFGMSTFHYVDEADIDWVCTIKWVFEFTEDLDQTPHSPQITETALYSFKFSCEIIGPIIEKYFQYERISQVISNLYDNDVEHKVLTITRPKS